MKIRSFASAFAAVATLCLAATSFADPSVTSVSPADGTVGTQFTITGTELGTKPPRAVLQLHGDPTAKKIPLKLTKPFDGTTIHATVLKLQPGLYDLIVTPNRGTPITFDSAFIGHAPLLDSLSATTIAPGDVVDINGRFFGTKRGKVTIGGITAKVKFWADGKITVVVSKKNKPAATATFDIFGKGGTQDDGAEVEVVAPLAGKDSLVLELDNGGGRVLMTTTHNMQDGLGFSIEGGKKAGFTGHVLAIIHTDTIGAAEGVYTTNLAVTYTKPGIPPSTYLGSGFTVTIARRVGARCEGTFSGTLDKLGGIGSGPATYHCTGTFTLTIVN